MCIEQNHHILNWCIFGIFVGILKICVYKLKENLRNGYYFLRFFLGNGSCSEEVRICNTRYPPVFIHWTTQQSNESLAITFFFSGFLRIGSSLGVLVFVGQRGHVFCLVSFTGLRGQCNAIPWRTRPSRTTGMKHYLCRWMQMGRPGAILNKLFWQQWYTLQYSTALTHTQLTSNRTQLAFEV